ncbi:MAG: fused MFS/spermidine synthase [Bacteroidota bacterium]|nr:fused MFS/spermidine synthase [Bacteroidota bacterium]
MNRKSFFYTISFFEGAAVMATEIIGAKFLAPLFGSSLYVWSSVMAMTLGGLAGGYFFGGRLSQKENTEKKLFVTLFLAGLFVLVMPMIIQFASPLAFKAPLLVAVVVCSCLLLIPPVFCMGMISPLIVQLISAGSADSGKRAGEVYAISTVGGILATFLTGFYLIPAFGLTLPLFVFGSILLLFSVFYFVKHKDKTFIFVFLLLGGASVLNIIKENKPEPGILYKNEGMLGKLEVMETAWDMDSLQKKEKHRLLLINNIIQTWVECDSNKSYLHYIDKVELLATKIKSHHPKALILGLGGGMAANVLYKRGFDVDVIELDERMVKVAHDYFNLSPKVNVIIDDARHGVERLNKQYDMILVDLFNAEVTPSHALSVEAISKIKTLLKDSALLVFNTYGYIQPPTGLGNLSLLKTISHCGLNYKIEVDGENLSEDYRNFLIVTSKSKIGEIDNELKEPVLIEKGSLITDNHPVLEYQNAAAAKRWRYYYLQGFIKSRKTSGV